MRKPMFDLDAINNMSAVLEADPAATAAWNERVRRMNEGSATREDTELHVIAVEAAKQRRKIPAAARRMPTLPAVKVIDKNREARALNIGIPPLFARDVLAGEVWRTPAIEACAGLGGTVSIVILIGERGAGKSFAAAHWLVNRVTPSRGLPNETPRAFVTFDRHDLMSPADREAIGRAACLVLDDVGAEKDRDAMATTIIRRHRDGSPTVITTNLGEEDFYDAYGDRIRSRLEECGHFASCGARSLRKRSR